jgi:hypothetical protein
MRLDRPAPMAVSEFESIVGKSPGEIEGRLSRLNFLIGFSPGREIRRYEKAKRKDERPHFSSLCWISSIILPTA